MSFRRSFRVTAVFVSLFALLLFGTAIGEACEAWQQHECAANPLCPICHLGQQVAESAAVAKLVAAPERISSLPPARDFSRPPDPRSPLTGTRAPPVEFQLDR
jgi:hypothetical protein